MRIVIGVFIWVAAGLALACGATAAETITFGTDWKAEAEHGGYYQAVATGIYRQHGLEVTLRQGGPQVNHAQLLAAGRLDFNLAPNSFIPLNFVQENIPLVAVAAIFQKDPSVLIAHPGQGNDSLAALKGKPIMIGSDTRITSWVFLKSKFGYTDDQIRPYTFSVAPFLADTKAVQQGYLSSEPFTIESQGVKPVVMLLADAGYSSYGSLIQTSDKLVQEKPDLVQRFVDASIEGWYSYLYGDPAPANALIKRDNPEMTDALLAYGIAKIKQYGIVDSGDAKTGGIGAMTEERWREFFDTMAKCRHLPQGSRLPQSLHLAVRRQESGYEALTKTLSPDLLTRSPATNSLVVLRSVGKRFATGVTALDGIDLDIHRGEFLSLLGPSGCGKSTLLRIIAGLSEPSSGARRLLLETDRAGHVPAGRIGFVFQDPTLMPWSTVTDNVLLPFRLTGRVGPAERERAAAEIQSVGLAGFERAYPRQLSGGMRMRVSIARALVTDPDLLLLDEPFAALDEITRMGLNDDLMRLWESRQPTVVFVTHSVFESVYLSTRIAVMTPRPGRIVAELPVALPRPRHRSLRTSPNYAALCAAVSERLANAMAAQ